jgi:hypothetical protein
MAKADITGRLNLDSTGFERGIQRSKQSLAGFTKSLVTGLLPALGAAGAAGALIKFGKSAIDSSFEITQLAKVSGVGVEEFQKFAVAAKTVNIEQDKLADIFKDTSDKMGDFLQVGSGPMVDFFEKIAPKVGATKEEFIGLSGPQALQKYFDYLKKANLPHQDMVFYMEAIASDATMLIPLLENGGEAFKTLGDGAVEAGRIMDEETIEALTNAKENLQRFEQRVTIFAGNLVAALMPAKDAFKELAKAQLIAEGEIRGNTKTRKSDAQIRKDRKEIEERANELRKQAEEKKAAEEEAQRAAAAAALQEREAEEERKRLVAETEKAEREAKRKAEEAKRAEREAERAAEEAARAEREAKEKAAAKRISDAKLKLLQAEAAQDEALTHEMKKQLELEQSIQSIMQSTNLDREQAVKLAKDLAAANAGADVNQSGYVTPREQRARESQQRKEDQARRAREREERAAEVGADERERQKQRDNRMSEREKKAGLSGTTAGRDVGGTSANDKAAAENPKGTEAELKEQTKLLTTIKEEIQKNP